MGALGDFSAWLDNKRRVAKRQLSDLFSDPNAFGEMQAARFDQGMQERLADPTSALDFVSGPVGGLAGVIRPGGKAGLNMVHNISHEPGFLRLVQGRRSMSNPSIAIAKDNITPFEQSATLVMNPNSPLFDPAQHWGNQLFNRDAYTFRARNLNEVPEGIRTMTGDPRKYGADMRNTEGIQINSPSQDFAMHASPRFKSLAEYENSAYGAENLINRPMSNEEKQMSKEIWEMARDWSHRRFPMYPGATSGNFDRFSHPAAVPANAVGALIKAAKAGDREASYILNEARQIPSEYAELKVLGEVPLNSRNVSALILPQFYGQSTADDWKRMVEPMMGVPVGRPQDLIPPVVQPHFERFNQRIVDDVRNTLRREYDRNLTPEESYGALANATRRYVDPDTYEGVAFDPKYVDEIIRNQIQRSPAFAADIAHLYTTRRRP